MKKKERKKEKDISHMGGEIETEKKRDRERER